jgi:hypothetical protein
MGTQFQSTRTGRVLIDRSLASCSGSNSAFAGAAKSDALGFSRWRIGVDTSWRGFSIGCRWLHIPR